MNICFLCNRNQFNQIQLQAHIESCLRKRQVESLDCKPMEPANNKQLDIPEPSKKKLRIDDGKIVLDRFAVDCFRYRPPGINTFFLTHFHADHYTNLNGKFSGGKIYCSKLTKKLITKILKVDDSLVVELEMYKETTIEGIRVTFLDANHCPGAVMILFELDDRKYLHCGDFRFDKHNTMNNVMLGCGIHDLNIDLVQPILEIVYLDTTYLAPQHTFPDQKLILSMVEDICRKIYHHSTIHEVFVPSSSSMTNFLNTKKSKKVLIVCGTYLIGKDRVWTTCSKAMNDCKVFVKDPKRMKIFRLMDDNPFIQKIITNKKDDTGVGVVVVGMNELNREALEALLSSFSEFDQLLCFNPTGWSFKTKSETFQFSDLKPVFLSERICVLPIPYSEHSSFTELKDFISSTKIRRIVPTVNLSKNDQMQEYFKLWSKK